MLLYFFTTYLQLLTVLLIYYSQWSMWQAELSSTAISAKNEPNNTHKNNNKNNNIGWLKGIRTPRKQQQPAPQKQQQHPLLGMQQLPHHPPSLSSLRARGMFTVNINRVIKMAQRYK